MNQTPTDRRAWLPVTLQVAGIVMVIGGSMLLKPPWGLVVLAAGLMLWIYGFKKGRDLAARIRDGRK